jgi:hypothetical protein
LGFSVSDEILFITPGDNHYLIGLNDSRIFLYGNDRVPKQINLQDIKYAQASVIVGGKWLNPQLFVLATLRGGMIFVNALSGKTVEIVNYATGLPDNEVYTLMTDKSKTVWAAHEYGFTRVSPYLRLDLSVIMMACRGTRFVFFLLVVMSTSGLHQASLNSFRRKFMMRSFSYVDVEVKTDQKKGSKKSKANAKETVTDPSPGNEPINESKKRGFLRFLKKKKN